MSTNTSDAPAPIDPKALRRSLGSFATGVAVITTRHDDLDVGITVNSFTSLSLDPPLVLWCLARSSRTFDAFNAAGHFIVNILAVDQVEISNRFAFRSDEAFPDDVPFRRALTDVPALQGTCANFQCRTHEVIDGGDHVVVVGEVLDFESSDRQGLVYSAGQYAITKAHPSAAKQSGDSMGQGFLATTVRPALDDITQRFESFFDEKLSDAGISSRESQILGLLFSEGALGAEEIANRSLVSGSFLEEALAALTEKGLLVREKASYALTAHGRELTSSWLERLRSYRAEALGSLQPAEADALQRTLDRLAEWIDAASSGARPT